MSFAERLMLFSGSQRKPLLVVFFFLGRGREIKNKKMYAGHILVLFFCIAKIVHSAYFICCQNL